jgi:excinuclease ABC subunit A
MKPVSNSFSWIKVFGAREHNLKNIDVAIPKNQLTIITGPSGSGKSSLALDILFAEGKRRYIESLSSYARQFLGTAKKPEVDRIEGLCPAIAIEQKTVGANPRSTVGTITEIYDYLRVLYARVGKAHCPHCGKSVKAESADTVTQMVEVQFDGQLITIVAPVVRDKKGEFQQELARLYGQGFYRFIIDGASYKFSSEQDLATVNLKKTKSHSIDIIIDSFRVEHDERSRLQEAVEKSFALAAGMVKIIHADQSHFYSSSRLCVACSTSLPEMEPRLFSFNSPIGACKECEGLGAFHTWSWAGQDQPISNTTSNEFWERYAQTVSCKACLGKRLNPYALAVTVGGLNIIDLCDFSIKQIQSFFASLSLDPVETEIAQTLVAEIENRLGFLASVGLGYLTLNRSARTLSGGEGQRIRLARQMGSSLSGVLYILDEPSIGLHQRDNDRLIGMLKMLREQGNTVVVVEHDLDTMSQADYIIDMGPAAGILGGSITAHGTPEEIMQDKKSLTGSFLSGKRFIPMPKQVRVPRAYIELEQLTKNNLKRIDVNIPLGVLCGVSGVSGSGKSTLVMDELVPTLMQLVRGYGMKRTKNSSDEQAAEHTSKRLLRYLVVLDQTPIGRTPRSNPATYLGIFDDIRRLFAQVPESQARGYAAGRFSFNMPEGRCAHCRGEGTVTIEMHFLPEVVMTCKQCHGTRYNQETLQVLYKGKNIADVLAMTAREAVEFFSAHSGIAKRLGLLCDVGLDYVALGQPSTTLSGGEAQRIKLVDELAKRTADTMYILDEPTTGLHSSDIEKLLVVLNRLVDKGNSMVIIEHNLDVLKTVDYLIDLGPEGGDEGGYMVVEGTPRQVASSGKGYTARYLAQAIAQTEIAMEKAHLT